LNKKNYTSEDVAAMAGVSQSTVSRVFAGGANVSEKKRKKIMEVAEKLNYQPNAQARSLITRKTHIIGIVMRNIRDPFYSAVLEIFYNRFAPLGYHLIFIHSENEEIQEKEITKLLEYNVEAAIITDAILSSNAAQKLERNDINVVLFNRYSKNAKSSAVFCDNYMAAKQIALYLVETGHQYFAFISGPINTSTTIDRLKGFEEVLKEKNIKNFVIQTGNYTYEGGFKATQELLAKHRKVDCIFCVNDITAIGAMDAIRTMGLKIPDDISVVGFDNIRPSGWAPYTLTTWEQPLEEMVTSTVEIIMDKINGQSKGRKTLRMKGQLIVRNTVRSRK
jgi:DNA-binding LacI/PurR family transcriptional regulator